MGMFDVVRSDSALQLSRLALDGMALRQDLTSENVANVDTPSYKAKEVNFETTLKRIMSGKPSPDLQLLRTNERHLDIPGSNILFKTNEDTLSTPRADGNNVDIDKEMLQMNENGVRQAAVTQLVARKLRILKDISRVR